MSDCAVLFLVVMTMMVVTVLVLVVMTMMVTVLILVVMMLMRNCDVEVLTNPNLHVR